MITAPLCLLPAHIPTYAQPVAIELVLAVDTSASVDDMEYALQMRGIAAALESSEIIDAIGQHKNGVAIALLQWSGGPLGKVAVDWTVVSSEASVRALSARVVQAPRANTGNFTAISTAINRSVQMLENNSQIGDYRRIDISGDGRNNSGQHPSEARSVAISKGITINGLAILDGDAGLAAYYRTNVTGGPGSFVISADEFKDFAKAMKRKLGRELSIQVSSSPAHQPDNRHAAR
ncbi:MAG: DUF1194 domain-containing protein [Anderseniella sp.]